MPNRPALLHDIGKMYVDERVISKPGKLTPAEFKQVMRHTVLGFQLMRQMPISSPRPAHVALQHHEHQSGAGYPNGLVGTNRIFRTPRERFDTTRMTLLAELAAVADVCSALSSDRPQRGAMAPPQVLSHLRRMAGEHLNAEAVAAFVSMVEIYPVGVARALRQRQLRQLLRRGVGVPPRGAKPPAGPPAV